MHAAPATLLAALLIDAAIGYPDWLFRAIGHPVTWMGALIAWLDRRLNHADQPASRRRAGGIAALAVLLAASVGAGFLLRNLFMSIPIAAALLAQRSLWVHVAAVAAGLRHGGLAGGRAAVSRIVGRNPLHLDQAGVVRAAIESLAENFSDGVVAPALWCAVLGLPGIVAYKAINTADSMIGHRTPRHSSFGWAAARLDDLVNLPASRLAGAWIMLAAALQPGASARGAWQTMLRDAKRHRSPNAGWPEAAMAGALGLRLNGPRVYGSEPVADAWMGEGRADCTPDDLDRALALYRLACALQILAVAILAAALTLPG